MADFDHNNPEFWKLGIFYFNPQDPRLVIPKRIPAFGLTVNFAHPLAIILVIALSVLIWFSVRAGES
jgi:uncharacterized membrane protein